MDYSFILLERYYASNFASAFTPFLFLLPLKIKFTDKSIWIVVFVLVHLSITIPPQLLFELI